jgi:formate dehydrogenase assembly factor FdhD
MAYGLDVTLIIGATATFFVGVIVLAILFLRSGGKSKHHKKPHKGESKKTESKKPKAEKKTATKSQTKKPETKVPTPKVEKKGTKQASSSKPAPKKKEAPQAAPAKPVDVAPSEPQPESLPEPQTSKKGKKEKKRPHFLTEEDKEDLEFALALRGNASNVATRDIDTSESAVEISKSDRSWAEINARNTEVQKLKERLSASEGEVLKLKQIIAENKKKMRDYNRINAKLASEKGTIASGYEDKIARLQAEIEARRENREVASSSGDSLRDKNYVVNVLQQERDNYKAQCAELQAAFAQLKGKSEVDTDQIIKTLQEQIETISRELQQERAQVEHFRALLGANQPHVDETKGAEEVVAST